MNSGQNYSDNSSQQQDQTTNKLSIVKIVILVLAAIVGVFIYNSIVTSASDLADDNPSNSASQSERVAKANVHENDGTLKLKVHEFSYVRLQDFVV